MNKFKEIFKGFPPDIQSLSAKRFRGLGKKLNGLFLRFSLQDQILFVKRLGILVKAGVPVVEGLKMLKNQSRSRATTQILEQVTRDVENGQFLSKSLGQFKNLFGDLALNIIRIGETSGTLHENLDYLAQELKKKQELRRKVIGSLIYPIVIVFATFGISGILVVYVFPKILPIFSSLHFQLPWTTRVLIWLSNLILHHGLWILLGLIMLAILGFVLMRLRPVRFWVHRAILTLPLFGKLSQNYQMANFCRTMGILLRCDVMIVEAMMIAAETTTNLVYQKEFETIGHKITSGEKISTHMSGRHRLFPPIITQMITVGETAGNLSETLSYLGEMYENEVDDQTKNLSTVIEPVLMIFMGILVGFIAISIITPIYGITQNLHP